MADYIRSISYVGWALAVGASVTLRLWCSARLSTHGGAEPFVASVHVVVRALFLSLLVLAPFTRCQGFPRGWGPWLAGACSLPATAMIMGSRVIGLVTMQMLLQLSMLSSAVAFDYIGGSRLRELREKIIGVVVVFLGLAIFVVGSEGTPLPMHHGSPTRVAISIVGAFATGVGYVLQARLSAVAPPSKDGPEGHWESAVSAAVVCLLSSFGLQAGVLAALTCVGNGGHEFHMRWADAPLWVFEAMQTAFFMRSMQELPARLGYSVTIAVSIAGKMLTAAIFDAYQGTGPFSTIPWCGLFIVVAGAVYSSSTHVAHQVKYVPEVSCERDDSSLLASKGGGWQKAV